MKNAWMMTVVGVGLAVAVGCAKPPTPEIEASREALSGARTPEASEYAAESLKAAEDAQARLDAELKLQEERFAMVRSYDTAKQLAEEARTAAERVVTDTNAGREQARTEVEQMLAQAQVTLDEVRGLVQAAPVGKGSSADIAALESDVTGIEQQLTAARASFDEGRYAEARVQASAAMQDAERVRADVSAAMEARGQQRRVS